jgi:hypothetical protein
MPLLREVPMVTAWHKIIITIGNIHFVAGGHGGKGGWRRDVKDILAGDVLSLLSVSLFLLFVLPVQVPVHHLHPPAMM